MPRVRALNPKQEQLQQRRKRVSDQIAIQRLLQGLTSEELATVAGVARSTLYQRLRYPDTMTLGQLWSIADRLGVSATDLIGGL